MSEKRIQFNSIIKNQLPSYVREEFPLVAEFLKQYYISQEFQGSSTDVIQNIDQYLKLDLIKSNADFTELTKNVSFIDEEIYVSSTIGFPNSYGLIQIDNEIITYTEKTNDSFIGCVRGFSGVTSYNNKNNVDKLVFKTPDSVDLEFKSDNSSDHYVYVNNNEENEKTKVVNLSALFLKEFFNKIKYQLTPGFENREFYSDLNKYLFVKQSKDFYSTRGTDLSFKILFNALYGEDVKIIKPQDYLVKPSDAQYEITNDLVVEKISGDPYELERSTLNQDAYGDITKAYASISKVEKIFTKEGKIYYKLSFDAGYNKDITFDGSLYGNFSVHPKTKLIGNVNIESTTLDVDSTIGFPSSGELYVTYNDGSAGVISYTSKNLNQFFGCKNITGLIEDSSDICLNVYAYGLSNTNSGDTVKVRITSVLTDSYTVDDTYYYSSGDKAIIKTLGIDANDPVSNNWIFNISTNVEIYSVELINSINLTYRLITKEDHKFIVGDILDIISNDGTKKSSTVTGVSASNILEVNVEGFLDVNQFFTAKRKLLKVDSEKYSYLSNEIANVQNVYNEKNNILVSSSSLPNYNKQPLNAFDKSVVFSGSFEGDTFNIPDHGFYTGDSVYYTPGTVQLFDEGVYFVKKVDSNNIKLSKSRENIYKSEIDENFNGYVVIENIIENSNDNKIEHYDFYSRKLSSQKLLRKISPSIQDGKSYETIPGVTGILINGVEVLNYKSKDKIYYGNIENIEVVRPGVGYDVINPPSLIITDSVGSGATGYCSIKGSLQEIRIIDPGFDYLETPKINITGGNGTGAKATASMKLIDHQSVFNSESKSAFVNIANNTIGFSTYHKFRNAEKVIYKTNSQKSVGGISTDSIYYVSTIDLHTIKLHKTFDNALSGINTISLTSYGIGNHILQSYNKKSIISSITVEDSGINYENKKRTVGTSGINTSLGYISINNHNFNSGEIINYSTDGSSIGGLSNNTNYYVTKVDDNNFKLSLVGVGSDIQDFYYKTNQYIQLSSTGTGKHIFNYPEIKVEVVGNVGISSTNSGLFAAVVQPIFRGQISSIYLENKGVGYGSSDIINFNRVPNVILDSGSEAQLIPIINGGKIEQIIINNPGKNYNSPPNLNIITNGKGVGAVLTPIIDNGQIKSIKVISSGAGYDPNNTFITVSASGTGSEFNVKLKTWTINLFQKYLNKITDDDGFIFYNPNSKYGLQYSHLYAPRKLRENLYSREIGGKILYGKFDLKKVNNEEIPSTDHSPIIGWAYDGNPIYGPYGFSNKNGSGNIIRLKSGYEVKLSSNRPPFASGFFVEDYVYKNTNDETVLDEHNGRFCITPDFPNGTYAYFATISESNSFGNYRSPVFPYLIGNTFKSIPNEFNYRRSSNQEDLDLNKTDYIRNTSQYNLLKKYSSYSYLNLPNNLNQTAEVVYSSLGFIENVGIITGGADYKVNDTIVFDDEDAFGFGFASKVSRIGGKIINSVSTSSTSINGVEIYSDEKNKNSFVIQSNLPHNLTNQDIVSISGLSTISSLLNGYYTISIPISNNLSITNPTGIGSIGVTGFTTFISVSANLRNSSVKENDTFLLGNEKIKVLNVDVPSSRIRVLRCVDNTVGTSHSYTDILYEIPRRFFINSTKLQNFTYKENRELYFDPKESVGVGTVSTVGAGKTIVFSNPGVGITQIFIPTRSIYIPNHNLQTGDELIYSSNSGNTLSVSNNGVNNFSLIDQSLVYVAKITNDLIGISTVKVGLGSTGVFVGIATTTSSTSILYFAGIGTGSHHSFKTNYSEVTAKVFKNIVTVSTAETHGLVNNDYVFVDVNPGISTTIKVTYNDFNRKILINPKSFESVGINTVENKITIQNHGFENGQKIIHTSSSPCGGLLNNKIYYIVLFDENIVQLSTSYYSAISSAPEIVNITSASFGELSPINPPIKVYRDSTINFDLSDESLSYLNGFNRYSAFELNFYIDSNYTQLFDKSLLSSEIEVTRIGRVGIDTNSKVTLKVNKNTPQKLYYKLDILNDDSLPLTKSQVSVDSSVYSNNEIEVKFSDYNGKHRIVSVSSTSFSYNLNKIPESLYYGTSSKLNYETTSLNAIGPISKVSILSKGQNYKSLPKFSEVISSFGYGAILDVYSNSIGKIKNTKINDIGFDFSCDNTIKPNIIWPQILKIDPLNSLEYIGITSFGRGYLTEPKLIILDGKTKEIIPEVELKYSLGDNYVSILKNTYRLNDVSPIIIPTQNSNGISIKNINFNSTTKNVSVTLSPIFSSVNAFPFVVGDRILIENTSVGINSTGKGFNSENYNYQLFTLNSILIDNNGGIGTVTYNLSDYLLENESPGSYDEINSFGKMVPEKYFPIFDAKLKTNDFFKNEKVSYVGSLDPIGFVQDWDENSKYLKVSSREILNTENILQGLSSKTQGKINSSIKFEGFINLGAYSKVENGWLTETGVLNNQIQRIQDNFYYQNFSYSLKSRVPYDKWEDAVGSLNHTAGFKKFADYQLESYGYSGINTSIVTNIDVTCEIDGFASLNCEYDFDLVKENSLNIGSKILSTEVTFSSKVLSDYFESIGNRVLLIDDISSEFNSNFRPTNYTIVNRFNLLDNRAQKYITYIRDKRYTTQRQLLVFTLLHDGLNGYLNQYARVETSYDLGSFDFEVEGSDGLVLFYPISYRTNDYDITTLSYNLKDNFAGVGNTTLGGIVDLNTNTNFAPFAPVTIVGVGSTNYTSLKVLVEIYDNNDQYQFDEINIIHDGSNINLLSYGQLSTHSLDDYSSSGLGTYYPYFSGSDLNLDFIPNVGVAASISTVQVAISNTSISGVGTFDIRNVRIESKSTDIASSGSPVENTIAEYSDEFSGGYFIVQVSDITNNRHQLSEIVVVNDDNEVYMTEFGNIETQSGIGTIGSVKDVNSTRIVFTPIPNIQTQVKVFFNALNNFDETNPITDYNNSTIESDYAIYYGTERDVRRSFELKHNGYPIFQRYFDSSDSSIVSVGSSTIRIQNHFFVTGEKITYSTGRPTPFTPTTSPIGIASTYFGVGIGTTDKLPSTVYAIKIDDNNIKLARSAEDALLTIPKALNITSVGIGTSHSFTSNKQNTKSLLLIDNIIQSPVVSTSTTTYLTSNFLPIDDVLYANSTNNLFINDLISIDDEIMKIEDVGVGGTNLVRVLRPWLGTEVSKHLSGATITKLSGDYNIVNNKVNFIAAPYGNVPVGFSTNSPDEVDWNNLSTKSSFQGRVFMRSGITETSNESYYKNYIFDDISQQFDGLNSTFSLKENKSNLTDIFNENAIILINNIFQYPGLKNNYILGESSGITSISFTGAATSIASDINTSGLPLGGLIVSIGSSQGFGYQPLISAGGTAIVSSAGTIASISIGNSGSGYRSSIQTSSGTTSITVRVGVATTSIKDDKIDFIGYATVNKGNIVGISITNPGIGYTFSNPPRVFIDPPISYSNIPLIYSNSSSGIGTQSTVDVVVGQGSSVIDFELRNIGYGYKPGDILTIPIGGATGIPTTPNSTLKEFQIYVDKVDTDKFSGWSMGEFEILDDIQRFFDGARTTFTLYYNGFIASIYARKGSSINIQDTLLVFVNDVLQVPGEGYIFNGGSKIQFTEPLKQDDNCRILFYKGSGDNVDVIFNDIVESVKVGDDIQITYDSYRGQPSYLLEDERFVTDILSIDTVETNPYFGPGNTTDTNLLRPVNWCRQTEDLVLNEKNVTKDRILYEPLIYPTSNIIQPVGVGSTIIFVESLRPLFNSSNENSTSQNKITLISQDLKEPASATAIVSSGGTISSINIIDGGYGYNFEPEVKIQNPTGIVTITSTAISSISAGVVTSITITGVVTGYSSLNPPAVLIEPPTLETESNNVISYSGDFGKIVGFGLTSSDGFYKVILDLYIPQDSVLRNASISGTATTISSLSVGDFFIVNNSNVGILSTNIVSLGLNGSQVGASKTYIDTVFQVSNFEIIQSNITGIGTTFIKRVYSNISGLGTNNFSSTIITFDSTVYTFDTSDAYSAYAGTISTSNYFGNYSWGKIVLRSRSKNLQFNYYGNNGTSGIVTSSLVTRYNPLKYSDYII